MRRRFFPPASPILRPPLVPTEGGNALPAIGATIIPKDIPEVYAQTPRDRRLAQPFDLMWIQPVPASGTLGTVLIGQGVADRLPQLAAVPDGYRGIVDGIFPYIEGVGGVVTQARIPGTDPTLPNPATIIWHVMSSGAPVPVYGDLRYIVAPWNGQSDRSLLELQPGKVLTCTVDYTDPLALYTYIGIRIKGRLLPWSEDLAA